MSIFYILNDSVDENTLRRVYRSQSNLWGNTQAQHVIIYNQYPAGILFVNAHTFAINNGSLYLLSNTTVDFSSITYTNDEIINDIKSVHIKIPKAFCGSYSKIAIISTHRNEIYGQGT